MVSTANRSGPAPASSSRRGPWKSRSREAVDAVAAGVLRAVGEVRAVRADGRRHERSGVRLVATSRAMVTLLAIRRRASVGVVPGRDQALDAGLVARRGRHPRPGVEEGPVGRRDACGPSARRRAVHSAPPRSAPCCSRAVDRPPSRTIGPLRSSTVPSWPIGGREVPARLGAPVPGFGAAGTASLAVVHTRAGSHRARPARRGRQRRARTVRGALGVTLLGAVLPGAGWLWSGRLIGYVLLVPVVGGSVYALATLRDVDALVDLATDPARLRAFAVVLGIGLTVWAVSVLTTYVWVRPAPCGPVAVGRRAPWSWRSPAWLRRCRSCRRCATPRCRPTWSRRSSPRTARPPRRAASVRRTRGAAAST